jgi:hypothetical protein
LIRSTRRGGENRDCWSFGKQKAGFCGFFGSIFERNGFLNDGLNGFTDFLRGNAGRSNEEFAETLRREVFWGL